MCAANLVLCFLIYSESSVALQSLRTFSALYTLDMMCSAVSLVCRLNPPRIIRRRRYTWVELSCRVCSHVSVQVWQAYVSHRADESVVKELSDHMWICWLHKMYLIDSNLHFSSSILDSIYVSPVPGWLYWILLPRYLKITWTFLRSTPLIVCRFSG